MSQLVKLHYMKYVKKSSLLLKVIIKKQKKNIASSVDDSIKHVIDFEISESLDFNKMLLFFPESDKELERSFQTKYEIINKEVVSQVNGVSKINKLVVKKQIQDIKINSVDKKMNN